MGLDQSLNDEPISRLTMFLPAPALRARSSDTVRSAIQRMNEYNVGFILIVEEGRLEGIFTERDLLKRVLGADQDCDAPLSRFMTSVPRTLTARNTVADAIRLMQEGGYRHIPVVDEGGSPVAVLSVKRIVHWLVEHYPTAVYNLPPTMDDVERIREGA